MADEIEIKVPDLGDTKSVDVIDVFVKPGDEIKKDMSLILLESDKATMEIPSPESGKIKAMRVQIGDKVAQGDIILTLIHDLNGSEAGSLVPQEKEELKKDTLKNEELKSKQTDNRFKKELNPSQAALSGKNERKETQEFKVNVPDLGSPMDVEVIEVLVQEGDKVLKEQALITLEGEKASMEIPSPFSGHVKTLKVKVGDKVTTGSPILVLETIADGEELKQIESQTAILSLEKQVTAPSVENQVKAPIIGTETVIDIEKGAVKEFQSAAAFTRHVDFPPDDCSHVHASPGVRRLAHELGVNLQKIYGSGRKSRITKVDLQLYVKQKLTETAENNRAFAAPVAIDFSQFGKIEVKPINKINYLTGINMHRAWTTIPHVTQFEEADITELDDFRKAEADKAKQQGYKLTILAFVTKVVANALRLFPRFNSALNGKNLILKQYYHIGIAVETANGLLVPVLRDVDQLSVADIALQMAQLSEKARQKRLLPAELSGGCFTISSLGGIGGSAFTPIVNSPEVAILGLSRASIKPVYKEDQFQPRLLLPLSLSYDHRVIDGAEAARFIRFIADSLNDIRRLVL